MINIIFLSNSRKRNKSEEGELRDSYEEHEEEEGEEDGLPHPLASVTKIDPDEIPEVPANKFLYRAGSANANQKEYRQNFNRDRMRNNRKGGRVFKGRGTFVCTVRDACVYLLVVS